MNAILELLVIGSISLAAICQTITVYEKMLLSPNEGEDAAVYCVGQVCVSCKDRTKSSTGTSHVTSNCFNGSIHVLRYVECYYTKVERKTLL